MYILTNARKTVLYTGVTNNLKRRLHEHQNKLFAGFSAKYNAEHLVYYEIYESIEAAISREKQLKGGSRKKKSALITGFNKEWRDLHEEIITVIPFEIASSSCGLLAMTR